MNTDLLLNNITAQDEPGLTAFDPRLTGVAEQIQQVQFEEAAIASQAIIEEEVYDIRIISYYIYGIFNELGPEGLSKAMQSTLSVLKENFEAVGPIKNKEKMYANSFKWLFSQILKKCSYEEKQQSDLWNTWLKADKETVDQSINELIELNQSCSILGKYASKATESVGKLRQWLQNFSGMLQQAPEPVVEEEQVAPEETTNTEAVATAPMTSGAKTRSTSQISLPPIEDSYAIKQLKKHMQTFHQLIGMKKYKLAAIASQYINDLLENFSPQQKLPEIFSPFAQNYALNINQVMASSEGISETKIQYLEKLYKSDLHKFLGLSSTKQTDFTSLDDLISKVKLEAYEQAFKDAQIQLGTTAQASQSETIYFAPKEEITEAPVVEETHEKVIQSPEPVAQEEVNNEPEEVDTPQDEENYDLPEATMSLEDFDGDEALYATYLEMLQEG